MLIYERYERWGAKFLVSMLSLDLSYKRYCPFKKKKRCLATLI